MAYLAILEKIESFDHQVQEILNLEFSREILETHCDDLDETGNGIYYFCFAGSYRELLLSAESDIDDGKIKMQQLQQLIDRYN